MCVQRKEKDVRGGWQKKRHWGVCMCTHGLAARSVRLRRGLLRTHSRPVCAGSPGNSSRLASPFQAEYRRSSEARHAGLTRARRGLHIALHRYGRVPRSCLTTHCCPVKSRPHITRIDVIWASVSIFVMFCVISRLTKVRPEASLKVLSNAASLDMQACHLSVCPPPPVHRQGLTSSVSVLLLTLLSVYTEGPQQG